MCENCDRVIEAMPEEKKDNWYEQLFALIEDNKEHFSVDDAPHTKKVLRVIKKAQELRDMDHGELQIIFEAIAFIAGMNDILPHHLTESVENIFECVISFRRSTNPEFRKKFEAIKDKIDSNGPTKAFIDILKEKGIDFEVHNIDWSKADEKQH